MSDSSSLSSISAAHQRENKDDDYDNSRGAGNNLKFYGDSSDRMNADIHIANFETSMRIKKIELESRSAVDTFSLTLKGNAQQWFFTEIKEKYEPEYNKIRIRNMDVPSQANEKLLAASPCQSFELVKTLFLEYFSDPTDQATVMTEIQTTKLTDFGSVDEYNDSLSSLFRRYRGLNGAAQVFIYINNCEVAGFKEYLMLQKPQTVKEAHNLAKLKESALKTEGLFVPYNQIEPQGQFINPVGRPGPARQSKVQPLSVNAVSPAGMGQSQNPRPMLSDIIGSQITTLFQDFTKIHNESSEKLNKSISNLTDVITKAIKEMNRPPNRQYGMSPRPNMPNNPYQGGQNGQRPNFQNRPRPQGQGNGNGFNSNNQKRNGTFVISDNGTSSQGDDDYDDDYKNDRNVNHVTFEDQTQNHDYDDADYSEDTIHVVSPTWPSETLDLSPDQTANVNTTSFNQSDKKTSTPLKSSAVPLHKKRVLPLFFRARLMVNNTETKDPIKVIVDTGSGITLISLNLLTQLDKELKSPLIPTIRQLPASEMPVLVGAALGSSLNVMGAITLTLKTDSVVLQPMMFIVVANLTSDIILGGDELSNGKLFGSLNVAAQKLTYLGNKKKELIQLELQDNPSVPSSILKGKNRRSPFVPGISAPSLSVGNLSMKHPVKINPHSSLVLLASHALEGPNRKSVENKLLGRLENASFVVSPTNALRKSPLVSFQDIVCDSDGSVIGGPSEVKIRLVNPSDQPVVISSGTVIANIEAFWSDGVIPIQTIMKQIQRHEHKMEEERSRQGNVSAERQEQTHGSQRQ
jgi:hypothetical protein